MMYVVYSVMFEGFVRQKETWKGMETVNKILNGGGGLSIELIKDVTLFFPRAKLLSAYGGYLSYIVSPKLQYYKFCSEVMWNLKISAYIWKQLEVI